MPKESYRIYEVPMYNEEELNMNRIRYIEKLEADSLQDAIDVYMKGAKDDTGDMDTAVFVAAVPDCADDGAAEAVIETQWNVLLANYELKIARQKLDTALTAARMNASMMPF